MGLKNCIKNYVYAIELNDLALCIYRSNRENKIPLNSITALAYNAVFIHSIVTSKHICYRGGHELIRNEPRYHKANSTLAFFQS